MEKGEKSFLYHRVPEDMRGTTLHPLNSLKDMHPDLYVEKSAKYKGREHVMEEFIPTLKAAWNDVLHFTAVHPQELKEALVEAGLHPQEMKFYQIDPKLLDPEKTTVYLYRDNAINKVNPNDFAAYEPDTLDQHSSLPAETKAYYKKMAEEGKRPILFVGVPHILHKGSLDISDLPVITV
jgi:hypothetical protein